MSFYISSSSEENPEKMGVCSSSAQTRPAGDSYAPAPAHPAEMEKSKSASSIGKGSIKSTKGSGKGELRRSLTESKIQQALLKKKMELAVADKPITFEKILLKFDKLRTVSGYIKAMFNEVAVDGHLDHPGLDSVMKRLGVNMALDEMLDLFDFVNVQEQKAISIKEFLVALTVGMVLDAIPALSALSPDPSGKAPQVEKSLSGDYTSYFPSVD